MVCSGRVRPAALFFCCAFSRFSLDWRLAVRRIATCVMGLIVTSVFSPAAVVRGADRVWNLQSGGNWSNSAAWSPNGVPQNGDRVFAMTISPQQVVINFDDSTNNKTFASMLIDNNGPG